VIVTGGSGVHDGHRHAEVILGDGTTCLLPSLPQGQGAYGHSQSGLMYCGGDNTEDSCLTFSAGTWAPSHTLLASRRWHSVWDSYPGGVLLLGGEPEHNTTEAVSSTSSSTSEQWDLSYDTAHACAISVPDSGAVVVTGGHTHGHGHSRVELYTEDGAAQQLPSLGGVRWSHACGYYYDGDDLVYLVTGGQHHTQNSGNLDTTELLSQGATSWVTSGALPGPRKGLKAARLNEKLILSGGHHDGVDLDDILEWDPSTEQWSTVGSLQQARKHHGMSAIRLSDVSDYCT